MEFKQKKSRLIVLMILIIFVIFLFSIRFAQIQIIAGKDYLAISQAQTVREITIPATRGEIVDRYGRPLVTNRMAFNVILDAAFIERGTTNNIIIGLLEILDKTGDSWIDNLPITFQNGEYNFLPNQDDEIQKLKSFLRVQSYATADNVMSALVEYYNIETDDKELARRVASVRYEMYRRDFSITNPYTFSQDVSVTTAQKVKENSILLSGVNINETSARQYPSGDIAPHIMGTIGPIYKEEYDELKEKGYLLNDTVGKAGIERAMENELRGQNGIRQLVLDSKGNVLQDYISQPAVSGNTVMLTIDRDLQLVAQQALEDQIKLLSSTALPGKGKDADVGAAVVVEIGTGEILAAATYPSYDINDYKSNYTELLQDPLSPLFNRALQGGYAPGSTFKPIVATGGLNEGIITTASHINCTRVYSFFKGFSPTCMSYHGAIDLRRALKLSCNIFFYDVGRQLTTDRLAQYAALYGIGEPNGLEISEQNIGQMDSQQARESKGRVWNPGDILQTSIGQGETLASPLQLANYYATIATRGIRYETHLVRSIKSYDLSETKKDTQPVVSSVIDAPASIFEAVEDGLVASAHESGGTSYSTFASFPIKIAAKTGTPEAYADGVDTLNSVYCAYAPIEDPKIAICVVIEKGYHGYTGAPVAKKILEQYFSINTNETSQQVYELLR